MTAVGPLPPGFSPIEADSLPAPPPEAPAATAPAAPYQNPLEAWATEPGQPFEPTIRRDLHPSGYLSASALRILEQGIARERAWGRTAADEPVILHASQIEARKRQAEQAAEAERKTRDPRAALQQAHQLRAEAVAEVERLQAPVERVHELVRSLEGRGREHEAEVKARQAAAAAALTRALAAGEPVLPLVEALNTATDPIAAELATARAALAQLEAQAKAAADRLARCHAGVARNAIAVLVDRAIDEAVSIVEAEAALHQRRADLDALTQLLTSETRRLNGTPALMPAQISRALYPPDRQLIGAERHLKVTDWQAEYDRLREDPREVEAGLSANLNENAL